MPAMNRLAAMPMATAVFICKVFGRVQPDLNLPGSESHTQLSSTCRKTGQCLVPYAGSGGPAMVTWSLSVESSNHVAARIIIAHSFRLSSEQKVPLPGNGRTLRSSRCREVPGSQIGPRSSSIPSEGAKGNGPVPVRWIWCKITRPAAKRTSEGHKLSEKRTGRWELEQFQDRFLLRPHGRFLLRAGVVVAQQMQDTMHNQQVQFLLGGVSLLSRLFYGTGVG